MSKSFNGEEGDAAVSERGDARACQLSDHSCASGWQSRARSRTALELKKESKNPFPPKGVISLGGATEQKLPTYPTDAFIRAGKYSANYYVDGIEQFILISGPYGSGKTHLVHYSMACAREKAATEDNSPRFHQIYAKAGSSSFVTLYRELVQKIDYTLLREINARFLGLIARQELEKNEQTTRDPLLELLPEDKRTQLQADYEQNKQEAISRFKSNPEIVFKYLDSLILQSEAILDRRASELRAIAGTIAQSLGPGFIFSALDSKKISTHISNSKYGKVLAHCIFEGADKNAFVDIESKQTAAHPFVKFALAYRSIINQGR